MRCFVIPSILAVAAYAVITVTPLALVAYFGLRHARMEQIRRELYEDELLQLHGKLKKRLAKCETCQG